MVNNRTTIPVDKDLHKRFKVISEHHRRSMKVMFEIMVEEFEKRIKEK
jgi:predicted transcriptional regulator